LTSLKASRRPPAEAPRMTPPGMNDIVWIPGGRLAEGRGAMRNPEPEVVG